MIAKYQRSHWEFAELDLSYLNQQRSDGDTLLHLVAYLGNLDEVELLVASGAQVNALGDLGYTPLHNAALSGHLDVAKRLLALGADPALRCEFGDTPLAVAEAMNINTDGEYAEIVEFLKQQK